MDSEIEHVGGRYGQQIYRVTLKSGETIEHVLCRPGVSGMVGQVVTLFSVDGVVYTVVTLTDYGSYE